MIQKFSVSRDDSVYQAWPDLALTRTGRLVCVFSECTHHGDRTYSRIALVTSDDRGRTWTPKRPLSTPLHKTTPDLPHWNCARITALDDGRLVVVVDQVGGSREGNSPTSIQSNWLFTSRDDGATWEGPIPIPIVGIVPDQLVVLKHGPHAGRWLLSAHRYHLLETGGERWMQRLWHSDDQGRTWHGPVTLAESDTLKLCEGSTLELPGGELVCFLRENSFTGMDCFKTISRDHGLTWGPVHALPMPGCHRPVAGLLQSGRVLITHRYLPGGRRGWGNMTQNVFATLTDIDGCLNPNRAEIATRVLPLDHDRSPHADTGYTGWGQFADGEIYVVNYLLDDAPKAQIKGYSLTEADIVLG
ncbi:MAG: sialidase family protein [Opitutaceae bacterium]|jgi:sialidase-1